jgi:hypothetical protein
MAHCREANYLEGLPGVAEAACVAAVLMSNA